MRNSLILLLLIFSLAGKSQSQYALSLSNTIMSDTAYMGSVLGYSTEIENSGTDTICFPVELFVSVNSTYWELNTIILFDSTCFAPGEVVLVDWPVVDTTNSLIVGGFIEVTEERSFSEGDNVIVVWPAITDSSFASQGYALETEQFINTVFVLGPSTLDESEKQPIGLFIDNKQIQLDTPKLQYYELYDVMGRAIVKGSQSIIDCNGLKSGVFILSVLLNNGQYQSLKVMIP